MSTLQWPDGAVAFHPDRPVILTVPAGDGRTQEIVTRALNLLRAEEVSRAQIAFPIPLPAETYRIIKETVADFQLPTERIDVSPLINGSRFARVDIKILVQSREG